MAITVTAVNDGPTAADDAYKTAEETVLTVAARGVLGNDSDPDGDPMSAVVGSGLEPRHCDLNANGSFSYTPPGNFRGSDSFTYRASEAAGLEPGHRDDHRHRRQRRNRL